MGGCPKSKQTKKRKLMKSLRYRNARNKSDLLGQVFTPPAIARLLVNSIPFDGKRLNNVVDLGAGKGALTNALIQRYTPKNILLVELDAGLSRGLSSIAQPDRSSSVEIIKKDVLRGDWQPPKKIDLILSNPPYGAVAATSEIRMLFKESNFEDFIEKGWTRGDLAFFLKAWEISSIKTNIGFIVAAPLMRDKRYKLFRERLSLEMRGLCVTQLNNNTFEGADVTAFLVSGCRSVNRRRNVVLRKAAQDGTIVDELEVNSQQASISLDIDFHRSLQLIGVNMDMANESMSSLGISVSRGSKSQSDFKKLGIKAFHTTDFPADINEVSFDGDGQGFKSAGPGDILIPRVGSRCLVRQVRVKHGEGAYTDCIYRLTGAKRSLSRAWKTLNSSFGAEWRLANANGSCARFLTLDDILSMPVIS